MLDLSLDAQCAQISWPVETMTVARVGKSAWTIDDIQFDRPEQLVEHVVAQSGQLCCWCEGASINVLMKAAALDVLAKFNSFGDRRDAVRRYLEAQMTILAEHRSELLAAMQTISTDRFVANLGEILSDEFVQGAYPRVRDSFVREIWHRLGSSFVVRVAEIFIKRPYDYRAGWPDLTVLDADGIRFVEVKTSDRLHQSQIRFATEVAAPLQLPCKVVKVVRRGAVR